MSNNQIIPFDDLKGGGKLPAAVAGLASSDDGEDWGSGQSGGFPVLSIKGKVFRIKRGENYELVTRPDDPDEAATTLQLSIVRAGKGVARTYYSKSYDEDSHDQPDCYSNDGVAPAADAADRQASKCATCPHSQWGSRITENGKKGKACSEVKRLAVAAPGSENDPMLLRVPPTSLKGWDQYVAMLQKKGLNPSMVVTKIGFDPEAAHQLLTYKPVGFVNEGMAQTIRDMREDPVVLDIVGMGPNSGAPVDDGPGPDAAGQAEPVDEPAPAKEESEADLDLDLDLDDEPPTKAEKPAETTKPANEAKTEKAAAPVAEEAAPDEIESDMDDMLGDLDLNFDD